MTRLIVRPCHLLFLGLAPREGAISMGEGVTFPLVSLTRLRMGTDGPGVTTLVVGTGCPLRCLLCPNSYTWKGDCKHTDVSVQRLYDLVRRDDLYFQATGGGVCFGGGEPLLHVDYIREFRAACNGRWNITAETSLNVPERNLSVAMECIDHFIVDIKDMNPEIYRAYTGADNACVVEGLRSLLEALDPDRVLVRVPHIPGYNSMEDVDRSIARLRSMGVRRIDEFRYVCPSTT